MKFTNTHFLLIPAVRQSLPISNTFPAYPLSRLQDLSTLAASGRAQLRPKADKPHFVGVRICDKRAKTERSSRRQYGIFEEPAPLPRSHSAGVASIVLEQALIIRTVKIGAARYAPLVAFDETE
jgi:hypothetical protein